MFGRLRKQVTTEWGEREREKRHRKVDTGLQYLAHTCCCPNE
jgi:hypothetical protein